MFRAAHHPIGTLALCLLLVASATGCYTTRRVPFDSTASLKHAAGVTMRSGWKIRFARTGASVSNDTLLATGPQGKLKLPADSVALVWNRKFSTLKTVGLVGGLAFVVLAIAATASFADNFSFGGH
jgi:hypothetical protein